MLPLRHPPPGAKLFPLFESPRASGNPFHRGATGSDGRGKVRGGQFRFPLFKITRHSERSTKSPVLQPSPKNPPPPLQPAKGVSPPASFGLRKQDFEIDPASVPPLEP
jgi:hypothetical protein